MAIKKRFLDEESEGYPIQVLGRGIYVTQAMKDYAWEKMSKVDRLGVHIMHVQVTLDIQKLEHICSITAKFEHFPLNVQASSTDMYASIDRAIDRLQTQLKRWKSRIIDHVQKKRSDTDVLVNIFKKPSGDLEEINAEIEEFERERQGEELAIPRVMGQDKISVKTLTMEEALMKIDLSGEPFLVYRDEADEKLKLLYERPDHHYGLAHIE